MGLVRASVKLAQTIQDFEWLAWAMGPDRSQPEHGLTTQH